MLIVSAGQTKKGGVTENGNVLGQKIAIPLVRNGGAGGGLAFKLVVELHTGPQQQTPLGRSQVIAAASKMWVDGVVVR